MCYHSWTNKKMIKQLRDLLNNEFDPAFAQRAAFIFHTVEKERPKKILDAGCGRGFYVSSLTEFNFIKEIHGIEVNSAYLQIAQQNCTDKRIILQRGSINNLPYKEATFDFVICSEVLEHLSDDKQALSELTRVLKPGGALCMTVPCSNFPFLWDPLNWLLMKIFNTHINQDIWWLAGIWADHKRLYTKQQLVSLLKNKFIILNSMFLTKWCWPFSHFLLYGIGKNIVQRTSFMHIDRFSKTRTANKPSLLAKLFTFPTRYLDRKMYAGPAVHIVVLARKMNIKMY